MSTVISANGLRKIADALDKLVEIEAATGIEIDGGHMGHVLVSLPATDSTSGDYLRIVRTSHPAPGEQGGELYAYGIEIEVP